jgi:hypothetical protein
VKLPRRYLRLQKTPRAVGLVENQRLRFAVATEFSDDFNEPDNIFVERRQVVGRNPIFPQLLAAHILRKVARQKTTLHIKSGDEACAGRGYVPVPCNSHSVIFGQDRIENRLFRKPGRKCAETRFFNKSQFGRPDRAKQRDRIVIRLAQALKIK